MKKLLALICLVLGLGSLCAHAADAEPAPTLWPAYDPDTGLWGYITEDGTWGDQSAVGAGISFPRGMRHCGYHGCGQLGGRMYPGHH